MRSLSVLGLLVLAAMVAGSGCGSDPIGPIGPAEIPFDLVIPPNRPVGDLYAVSGVSSTTQLVRVGDSIVESTIPAFYAQFHAAPGGTLPASVFLNDNPLERSRGGDTLRLDEASSTSIFGNNIWKLADGSAAADSFTIGRVDVLDSIGPLRESKNVRSDTNLQLGWMPPRIGSGGMYLIWKAPDSSMMIPIADIGSYTVESADLKRLQGKGTVTFVRFLNIQKTYKGRKLILTRLAQHRYEVTVQ
jgi:hypothetical protein